MGDVRPRVQPAGESVLPHVSAKIHALGCDFLFPYLGSSGCFVDRPEEADFILAMNNSCLDNDWQGHTQVRAAVVEVERLQRPYLAASTCPWYCTNYVAD